MNHSGGRKFHGQFVYASNKEEGNLSGNNSSDFFQYINNGIIGKDLIFNTAFGDRKVLYCDYTASGRSLKFIEEYISENVLPHYGNTHTTTTVTSLQTTMFRQEARDLIRKSVNASESDAVIFTSSGCTGAVHKLIHGLNLQVPPIVIVSPYEHHSNLIPWKEIGSKIIWSRESKTGMIDLGHLETILQSMKDSKRPILGCFAAASNITGTLVDVDAICYLFHRYNALIFFDYATAGPYVDIDMNPALSGMENVYKDAMFISTHKFIGGPGTPGILIAKKKLFTNPVPESGGGGTVFFVTENTHRYLKDIEMREEGGTPAIVESIRAGLVFQLKDAIRSCNIAARDAELLSISREYWRDVENLVLLGNEESQKLPIFSFLIKHQQSNRFLHHNYVSALLNDLFGIQSRSGCACAGPYAQRLLGMSEDIALNIESFLLEDQRLDRHHLRRQREYSDKEILRPGLTRLNLPYFCNDEEIDFILKAVKLVAEKGWMLLPKYLFDPETGEWKHRDHKVFKDRKWLGGIRYDNKNGMTYSTSSYEEYTKTKRELLEEAQEIFQNAHKSRFKCGDQTLLFGEDGENLRWFLLPCEAEEYLKGNEPSSCLNFSPPFYPGKLIKDEDIILGDKQKYIEINSHYCNCMPYRKEIVQKTPQSRDNNNPISNGEDNAKIKSNLIDIKDNITSENTTIFNGDKEGILPNNLEESSVDSETCTLLCKPIVKRSLAAKDDIKVDLAIKFHNPPKNIFKPAVEGIEEFEMIGDGDRILICLSGGKDSLSMLHIIHQYKFYAKKKGINFEFGAMTVDPLSAGYDPSPLIGYCKSLNVEYHYEEQDIIGMASKLPVCESICSFCSRMKRGRIYSCARREKYNVIALGQHLDDIAESFLMSTFHNGYLRSMKANYSVTEGDLRVIRPLIYVREKNLRSFAEKVRLPVIPENCPACFEAPKERHRMKQLLAQQEILFPNLFQSLRAALNPLISKSKTGLEKRNMEGNCDEES